MQIERHQQKQQKIQQHHHQQQRSVAPSSSMGASSSRGSASAASRSYVSSSSATTSAANTSATSSVNRAAVQGATRSVALQGRPVSKEAVEREVKKKKERFLLFTRVLLKYLERKDSALHSKVKAVIMDCAKRNKRGERGYESVTHSMNTRLKQIVNDTYWKRAEAYLDHFLKTKQKQKQQQVGGAGGSSSTGSGSSASAAAAVAKQQAQVVEAARRKQQQQQAAAAKRQQQKTAAAQVTALQQDIAHRKQQLTTEGSSVSSSAAASAGGPTTAASSKFSPPPPTTSSKATTPPPTTTTTSAAPVYPSTGKGKGAPGSGKGRKSGSKKSSTSPKGGAAAHTEHREATGPPMAAAPAPPPVHREHSELMEQLEHHDADFDLTLVGLTLGQQSLAQVVDEQRALLYRRPEARPLPLPADVAAFPVAGWGRGRNVVSARTAWSRLRLPLHEREAAAAARQQQMRKQQKNDRRRRWLPLPPLEVALRNNGRVTAAADSSSSNTIAIPTTAATLDDPHNNHEWHNEQEAEKDKVLAVLSEGAQLYLKQVLEKALHCSRNRQGLEGIRLWNQQAVMMQQQATAAEAAASKTSNKRNSEGAAAATTTTTPLLSVRLGGDVSRQLAQAQGNAALTCKCMEDALARQRPKGDDDDMLLDDDDHQNPQFTPETLHAATGMADLALRLPQLDHAAAEAETNAKRAFEIVSKTSSSRDPPLGRVPKKAKLEVVDFEIGQHFGLPGRHKAGTVSSSIFF